MAQSCISFAAPAQVRKWQILLQKSFPLVTKNSPGCRRDFRVKMWGTSSPDDKLAGDLAKAAEATKIGARRSDRLMAGNYHRSIAHFCNNIGTTRTLRDVNSACRYVRCW